MQQWIIENLITELIFGVLIFGLILASLRRLIVDLFRAWWLLRNVLLVHNQPSRTWQKGLSLADRFMQLYESHVPLRSANDRVATYSIWPNQVIDTTVLKFHGLVTIVNRSGIPHVEAVRNQLTGMLYRRLKRLEEKEKQTTEHFMQSTTLRDLS